MGPGLTLTLCPTMRCMTTGPACFGIRGTQKEQARLGLHWFSAVTPFHMLSHSLKDGHNLRALCRWHFRGCHGRPCVTTGLACVPRAAGARSVNSTAFPSQPQVPDPACPAVPPYPIPTGDTSRPPSWHLFMWGVGGKMSSEAPWSSCPQA